MTRTVLAARDSSPADRSRADTVCDGKTDVAVLARAMSQDGAHVELCAAAGRRSPGLSRRGSPAGSLSMHPA